MKNRRNEGRREQGRPRSPRGNRAGAPRLNPGTAHPRRACPPRQPSDRICHRRRRDGPGRDLKGCVRFPFQRYRGPVGRGRGGACSGVRRGRARKPKPPRRSGGGARRGLCGVHRRGPAQSRWGMRIANGLWAFPEVAWPRARLKEVLQRARRPDRLGLFLRRGRFRSRRRRRRSGDALGERGKAVVSGRVDLVKAYCGARR